jgi:predicted ABC-type ATPase
MDDAMNSGMDVVVQGTGKRTEHLRDAKARGYKTSGHFVWIPDREADRRIVQRTAEGGPNIPTYFGSQIAGELRNGDGRFRGLSHDIAEGLYDEFYLWDNTGREPRLIAYRTQDGQFAIHGRKEFDDFFGASGRYVERYWQKNK